MKEAVLTTAQHIALSKLREAVTACSKLGVIVFSAARVEQEDGGTHFDTYLSIPDGMSNEMLDHCFADAVRDLSVEWSNQRHTSKLDWITS